MAGISTGGTRNEFDGQADVSVQARDIHGGVHVTLHAEHAAPPPRQLAPPPRTFVNQRRVLAELTRVLAPAQPAGPDSPARVAVLHGVGGVGKSAAALTQSHAHRDRYPDGDLYADLAALGTSPAGVDDVLAEFLMALGEAPSAIPASGAARAARFRSRTHGRRLLLLLENATRAEQVLPLLPGAGGSAVLVTARQDLPELWVEHGAELIELDPLEPDAARQLLERLVGPDRLAAEPEAVDGLLAVCAGLPIALCVVGALARARPRRPLGRLWAELADERGRLERLRVGGRLSVTAAFAVSYRDLSPAAAVVYQAMGAHPGRGAVGVPALAAAVRVDQAAVRQALAELASARLVEEVAEDRHTMHELVRLHARQTWERERDEPGRAAMLADLFQHYLRFAIRADLAVMPDRGAWVGPGYHRQAVEAAPSEAEAWSALETERPNLRAVVEAAHQAGEYDVCWQLCEAMWGLLFHRKYFDDWLITHQLGLDAARRCQNPAAEARVGVQLGFAHLLRDDVATAAEVFAAAIEPATAAGSLPAQATAVESVGLARLRLGEHEAARELLARNLALAERIGHARRLGLAHHHLGRALSACGSHSEALEHLDIALAVLGNLPVEGEPGRVRPDAYNVGRVLTSQGTALVRAGRADQAAAPLREALAVMARRDNAFEQVQILVELAGQARATGDLPAAAGWLRRADELAQARRLPQAERVRAALAELAAEEGPER